MNKPKTACVLLLLLVGSAAGSPTDDESPEPHDHCGLDNHDPTGDVAIWPGVVPDLFDHHSGMDLARQTLWMTPDQEVVLQGDLADAPPKGPSDLSYRFWFGFHVQLPDGTTQYMDVRMHHAPYTTGSLIGSNQFGNPLIAELDAEHDGPRVTFRFPLDLLEPYYDTSDVSLGSPESQSDGPHIQGGAQATTYIDYNFWQDGFTQAPVCTS